MNTFANAVANQEARTQNGMKAFASTTSPLVDLFFKIGASRGKNILPEFTAAYAADREVALRIAQWSRDVRGGAGERKLFRDILMDMEKTDPDAAIALLSKVPELGRWDDMLLDFTNPAVKAFTQLQIKEALEAGNGLAAKWMPRKGEKAVELRNAFGWSPKFYRKRLVELTKVVETQMCNNAWDEINFNHVPSLASSRYKKAFNRHTSKYAEWAQKLASGDKEVKVNAGAVYPYDVLKGVIGGSHGYYNQSGFTTSELQVIEAQWNALPNYIGDANVLPLVDVSGSMTCGVGAGKSGVNLTCLDVAVSLGLYLADKNKGKFKDTFLTFSGTPQLVTLKGNILDKVKQLVTSKWEMNTNLHAALDKVLSVAKSGNVPQSEMPDMLLVLSDMQFDSCTRFDDSAMQMIARKYQDAGYELPKIVFWNISAHDNVPVKFDTRGVALVSGFSPTIVKSVLAADLSQFTPEAIMLKTVMVPRYDI